MKIKIKRLWIALILAGLVVTPVIAEAALPTPANIQTMDYAFQGQPFVEMPAKSTIDTSTMDYSFQGQPFVRILTWGWTHISKVDGVSQSVIGYIMGVIKASIGKLNGVTP
jgi:hypothetical protein